MSKQEVLLMEQRKWIVEKKIVLTDLAATEVHVVVVVHGDVHQGLEPVRLGDAVGGGEHVAAPDEGAAAEGADGDLPGGAVVVLEVHLPRVLVEVGVLAIDDAVRLRSHAAGTP